MEQILKKPGIYTFEELILEYGTTNQIENFKKNMSLVGNYKVNFYKILEKYYEFKELKNQRIKILKAKETPFNFEKMNSGIYKYLIPTILNCISKNTEASFEVSIWTLAAQFYMINKNYVIAKLNKKGTSELLFCTEKDVLDFFDRVDRSINQYLTTALRYIAAIDIIYWDQMHITTLMNGEERPTTKTDFEICTESMRYADDILGINAYKEGGRIRFFGKDSVKWKKLYNQRLEAEGIKRITKRYTVVMRSEELCQKTLALYEITNQAELTPLLSNEFMNKINENAKARHNDNDEKYSEAYLNAIFNLCELTINCNPKINNYDLKILLQNLYTREGNNYELYRSTAKSS